MTPFFSRRRREQDLDEEIRTHIRMAIEERVAQGESPADAERAVRREFGDEIRVKEVTRTMWGGVWLDRLVQDIRFGVRSLARDRGFAFVAILTLALGVGVTTAMFTVVNGVLFRPLPFFEPDRLVSVGLESPGRSGGPPSVKDELIPEMRRQSSSLAGAAGYMVFPPITLTGAGEAARLAAGFVTSEFFDVLNTPPAMGRGFVTEDDQPGAGPVVLLGDALWRTRFGADPDILGKIATLEGVPWTIVGVMPPGFDFPDRTELWLPLSANPLSLYAEGISYTIPVMARLGEGVTPDQAASELTALAAASGWTSGRSGDALVARVLPLKDVIIGDSRYPLLLFTGAVALVLLISCTNVANLMLMRAGVREREIGLRRVLGAGSPRLVRQLLTESVMVAFVGGTFGIGVAAVGVRALLALAPAGTIPRGQELGIDFTVLAFTLLVCTVTGIGFGLAPAFKATHRELRDTIAEGARTHSPRRGLARRALVVAEVGLAVVLLAGAGLLIRSFQQIRAIDLGFEPENTLTFDVDLPEYTYANLEPAAALHNRVIEGLGRIPGVEAVGAVNFGPFGALHVTSTVHIDDTEEGFPAGWMLTSPGYFEAMGIPLLSGNAFTDQDDASTPDVVVISRAMAEQLWPNRDPVGQRLSNGRNEWRTVVGVAEDIVIGNVTANRGPMLMMYVPLAQITDARRLSHMDYVVRTAADTRIVAPAMRSALQDADPNLPAGTILSMDDVVVASVGDRLFQTRVLGVFAVLAMLLAAIGIYGVTSYSVAERTQEVGIRMALGARADQVAKMTLGQVLQLVVPGLLVGAAAAMAATRFISPSLYEISPGDPATLVGVTLLLGVVAVIAALVPIRRATRINPVEVLSG